MSSASVLRKPHADDADTGNVRLRDWIRIDRRRGYRTAADWPERIDLVVFDFDGVMTDNRVLVSSAGDEAVLCHRGDGWGIGLLRAAGVEMLVLSTEANPVVEARCRKLEIPCHQDIRDKGAYLRQYLGENGIEPRNVAFVGNDENDLECLRLVGLPVVVADAEPGTRAVAKVVLSRKGGNGAVREFAEQVLRQRQARTGHTR